MEASLAKLSNETSGLSKFFKNLRFRFRLCSFERFR